MENNEVKNNITEYFSSKPKKKPSGKMKNITGMLKESKKLKDKRVNDSPFVNYFSHSLGMNGVKDIKKDQIEPMPNIDNIMLSNSKEKENKFIELNSFDLSSEFDKLKKDMMITLRDNLNLNIPLMDESRTDYNTEIIHNTNKELNQTNPVTINKKYKENNTTNKIEKSYPVHSILNMVTKNDTTSNKIDKIRNTFQNSIINTSKSDKNSIINTSKSDKNSMEVPIKNYITTKSISPTILNTLRPESITNTLDIDYPVSDVAKSIGVIGQNPLTNITENKQNNNISKKYYYEMKPMMEAFSTLIQDEKEIPVLPGLAKGGLVKNPTQMVVGDAGPELAMPLSKTPDVIGDSLQKSEQIKARQTSKSLSENTKGKLDASSENSEEGGNGGSGNALANNSITSVSAPNIGVGGGGGGSKFSRSLHKNTSLPSWRSNIG